MTQICPSCGFIDDSSMEPNAADTSVCPACGAAMLPDVDGLDFDLESAFEETQTSDFHNQPPATDDSVEVEYEAEFDAETSEVDLDQFELKPEPAAPNAKQETQASVSGPTDAIKLPFEMVPEGGEKSKKSKGLVARLISGVALAAGLLIGLLCLQLACWWVLGLDPLKAAFVLPDSLAFIAPSKLTPKGIEAKMREPIRNLTVDNDRPVDDEESDDEEEELSTPPETPDALMANSNDEAEGVQPTDDTAVAMDDASQSGEATSETLSDPTEAMINEEDPTMAGAAGAPPALESETESPAMDVGIDDASATPSTAETPSLAMDESFNESATIDEGMDPSSNASENPTEMDLATSNPETSPDNDTNGLQADALETVSDPASDALDHEGLSAEPAAEESSLVESGSDEPAADESFFGNDGDTADAPAAPQVGPASAPPVSRNDLAAANVRAAEALDTLAAAQATPANKDDIKLKARDAYVALAELGKAAALVDLTGDDVRETLSRSTEILQSIANHSNWRRMVGTSAAGWMKSGRGEGVIASGEVTSASPSDGYWEIDIRTPGKSVTLKCLIPNDSLPNPQEIATVGNQITLFGWIAKNPQESIHGYNGDASEVVWTNHMVTSE